MTEERVTEKVNSEGKVTERVVERGTPDTVEVRDSRRSGGGGAAIWGVLALIAVVFAIYLMFFKQSEDQQRQADALTNATAQIGESVDDAAARAQETGDAVEVEVDTVKSGN